MPDSAASASPCNGQCTLDHAGSFCRTCRRSLREIVDWSIYSEAQRAAVLRRIALAGVPTPQDGVQKNQLAGISTKPKHPSFNESEL